MANKNLSTLLKVLEILMLIVAGFTVTYKVGWSWIDESKAFMSGVIIGLSISVLLLIITFKENDMISKFQCIILFAMFIYMIVTSSLIVSKDGYKNVDSVKAGGAFGILAALAYLGDAIYSFMENRPF